MSANSETPAIKNSSLTLLERSDNEPSLTDKPQTPCNLEMKNEEKGEKPEVGLAECMLALSSSNEKKIAEKKEGNDNKNPSESTELDHLLYAPALPFAEDQPVHAFYIKGGEYLDKASVSKYVSAQSLSYTSDRPVKILHQTTFGSYGKGQESNFRFPTGAGEGESDAGDHSTYNVDKRDSEDCWSDAESKLGLPLESSFIRRNLTTSTPPKMNKMNILWEVMEMEKEKPIDKRNPSHASTCSRSVHGDWYSERLQGQDEEDEADEEETFNPVGYGQYNHQDPYMRPRDFQSWEEHGHSLNGNYFRMDRSKSTYVRQDQEDSRGSAYDGTKIVGEDIEEGEAILHRTLDYERRPGEWTSGIIRSYRHRSGKHRIDFADNTSEWVVLTRGNCKIPGINLEIESGGLYSPVDNPSYNCSSNKKRSRLLYEEDTDRRASPYSENGEDNFSNQEPKLSAVMYKHWSHTDSHSPMKDMQHPQVPRHGLYPQNAAVSNGGYYMHEKPLRPKAEKSARVFKTDFRCRFCGKDHENKQLLGWHTRKGCVAARKASAERGVYHQSPQVSHIMGVRTI